MIYPDLNLGMNGITILNDKEISLNFRFIHFMTCCIVSRNIYLSDLKMAQSRGRNMSSA